MCLKCGSKNIKEVKKYAEEGQEDGLDPNCVKIFKRLESDCYETYQAILAELEAHMESNKWG